ncbi:hypothetical protein VTK56DRAFT_1562 [Thermocarpiscus australiensis]
MDAEERNSEQSREMSGSPSWFIYSATRMDYSSTTPPLPSTPAASTNEDQPAPAPLLTQVSHFGPVNWQGPASTGRRDSQTTLSSSAVEIDLEPTAQGLAQGREDGNPVASPNGLHDGVPVDIRTQLQETFTSQGPLSHWRRALASSPVLAQPSPIRRHARPEWLSRSPPEVSTTSGLPESLESHASSSSPSPLSAAIVMEIQSACSAAVHAANRNALSRSSREDIRPARPARSVARSHRYKPYPTPYPEPTRCIPTQTATAPSAGDAFFPSLRGREAYDNVTTIAAARRASHRMPNVHPNFSTSSSSTNDRARHFIRDSDQDQGQDQNHDQDHDHDRDHDHDHDQDQDSDQDQGQDQGQEDAS